jgi:hypothetical protein
LRGSSWSAGVCHAAVQPGRAAAERRGGACGVLHATLQAPGGASLRAPVGLLDECKELGTADGSLTPQSGCTVFTSLCTAQVANTLWSYATLGHDPGAQLLDAIAAHMCDRMHVFRPQAISNSLWVRRRCPDVSAAAHVRPHSYARSCRAASVTHQLLCPQWWFLPSAGVCEAAVQPGARAAGGSRPPRPGSAAPVHAAGGHCIECCTHWGPHTILIAVAHPREGSYMGNIGHHGSHTN